MYASILAHNIEKFVMFTHMSHIAIATSFPGPGSIYILCMCILALAHPTMPCIHLVYANVCCMHSHYTNGGKLQPIALCKNIHE